MEATGGAECGIEVQRIVKVMRGGCWCR
jgi:hypothetical protein